VYSINSFLVHFCKSYESNTFKVMLSISIYDEKVSKYESFPLAAVTTIESIVTTTRTKKVPL